MKKLTYLLILFVSNFLNAQQKVETAYDYQFRLNRMFKDSLTSPLTEFDRYKFQKLDFYPVNEKFLVNAKFYRVKGAKVFEMKTTTTRTPKYQVYGLLKFQIEGKDYELFVYKNIDLSKKKEYKDYLFLPFSDLTNGDTTYGGGRYLDMKMPKTEFVIIDFNKAYNPYCAYNPKYSCPLVPEENFLNIPIEAGVKKFH